MKPHSFITSVGLVFCCICIGSVHAHANETRNFAGMRGLNTVPDARFDETGRVNLTLSHLYPYTHSTLGAQITDHLYVSMRQTSQSGDPLDDPERLYPGVDTKLKLWNERKYLPQAAIGLQSAFGHKQTAGEYISFSKRFFDLDLTGGLGWGRFGSAGHFKNPLKIISHFDKPRNFYGEQPNGPEDWFIGENVGLFGGFSYTLPQYNLAFTADWNADRYSGELSQNILKESPSSWSVGLQYQPYDFINAGVGLIGGDKVLTRLTLQPYLPNWSKIWKKERPENPIIRTSRMQDNKHVFLAHLPIEPHKSSPRQMQKALRYLVIDSHPEINAYAVQPRFVGLHGPRVILSRRALQQAYEHNQGSAEEVWASTEFNNSTPNHPSYKWAMRGFRSLNIKLQEQVSVSEIDQGVLHRTSLILERQRTLLRDFISGGALRINLTDNLDLLDEYRLRPTLPVRSDVDIFSEQRFSVEKLYLSYLKTITPDLYMSLTGGYLEEQYAGLGGEILYRPFGKNWAIGADGWQVFKRDPYTELNQGIAMDHLFTGHLNGWYRLPQNPNLIIKARIGRYLAEDIGGSLILSHKFNNGTELEGFITHTDAADTSVFGEDTYLYNGIRLSLPLGNIPYTTIGTSAELIAAPFGRDNGQTIQKPVDLYDMTEAFSLQHMSSHWGDIIH